MPHAAQLWRDFAAEAALPPADIEPVAAWIERTAKHMDGAATGALCPSPELDKLSWVTREETQNLPLPNITQFVIASLEDWLRPASADDPACRVPFHYMRHGQRRLDWE